MMVEKLASGDIDGLYMWADAKDMARRAAKCVV